MLFLGIGLFIRGILGEEGRRKWWFIAGGILLILAFKAYVLLCALPAILFYWVYRALPRFKALGTLLIFGALTTIVLLSAPGLRNKFVHVLSRKQYDFINVGHGGLHAQADTCFYFFTQEQIPELNIVGDSVSIEHTMHAMILKHGSIDAPIPVTLEPNNEKWFIYFRNDKSDGFIHTTMIHDSFSQLLKNIPEALLNSLFRPYFPDPGSWLKYPAMLEVFLLYAFLLFAIFRRRKLDSEQKALIWAILVFVVALSLTIGWVTPVLGAIVRYRIPAFVGLLIIALFIYQPKSKTHE